MKITIMLADFAQAVNGKLYIMGGGWSLTGPLPSPSAIAIKVEVPWNDTNRKHSLKLELLDGDYRPVSAPTPDGQAPVAISGEFEVGRPPGMMPGTPIDIPFAFNLPPFPLEPGRRYVWRVSVDGKAEDDWEVAFSTRKAEAGATA